MNINRFKNITEVISKKDVYLASEIDSNELALIDKGFADTLFNVGINDVLEFELYDIGNNILGQTDIGTTRYIKGDHIKNYLLKSNNPNDTVTEGGGWLVDVKKLIQEAGYNTGYFRVQLNFLNNRVGSDYPKDKLWIQQISPSRTEVRMLPYNNFDETNLVESDVKRDLNQAYDSFVLGKFSADEVYEEIDAILSRVNATDVANMILTIYPKNYVDRLQIEFSINGGIERFYNLILTDMKAAVRNQLLYRDSTIGSNTFGNLISDTVRSKVSQKDFSYYSKQDIIDLLNGKFRESVMYHLPKRNLTLTTKIDDVTMASLDLLTNVMQTLNSSTEYGIPQVVTHTITPPPPPPPPPPSPVVASTPVVVPAKPTAPAVTKTPVVPQSPPSVVTGPTASNVGQYWATISWTTSQPAIGDITFMGPNTPTGGSKMSTSSVYATNQSLNISGLSAGTTYRYQINTKNNNGIANSPVLSFTTLSSTLA